MAMSGLQIAVEWRPRPEPLEPVAVAARGEAARAVARRLLARPDEALGKVAGVAGDGVLVLIGEAAALPWADGVVYLGRDPAAPGLLLPTALTPSVPLSLLERALLERAGAGGAPLAVLPGFGRLVSLAAARPVARAPLVAWLRGAG
jgi:hypothetical protein